MFNLNVEQDVPDFAMLWLPPFPARSATRALVPFNQWSQPGIHIMKRSCEVDASSAFPSQSHGYDGSLQPLVDITQSHTSEAKATRQKERLLKRLAEGGALVRIRAEDCLKIGEEDSGWEEPEGTANEGQYQVDSSPFDRLISATRDFLYSRDEEFQYHRSRRLFNTMRDSFGLRTDRKGSHWQSGGTTENLAPENETCSLLRDTNSAVRGFLALARTEAEAGWNSEPSLKLCQIVAAFLSYVVHHRVFSEEPFASRFEQAANLARTAPRRLKDSLRVEDALAQSRGWNAASWALWGGQYGDAGRGDLRAGSWPVDGGSVVDADGGWGLNSRGLEDMTLDQGPVGPHIEPLLQPIAIDEVKLLDHIPYARRRITEVVVPGPSVDKPAYLSQLCCILTVPSPWTEAEGWRRSPRADHPTDDEGLSDAGDGPLELELATVEEPEQLAIWVERSVLVDDPSGQCLIGMALRGRWGLFGDPSNGEGNKWWAFKSKNYILPALWSEVREDDKGVAERTVG